MELQEFIKTTLVSIKNGVQGANIEIAEKEGKTRGVDANCYFGMDAHSRNSKEGYISFDIAVTVSEESKTSGGGKIKIAVAGLGGEVSDLSSREHISKIKFNVLPYFTIA